MQRYIDQANAALQVADQAKKEDASAAAAALSAVIDDPLYGMLPKEGQRMLMSAMAWSTWQEGKPESARDLYLQATKIDGNEPHDWYRLAILERHLGDMPRSARYMTALVRRWPDRANNLDRQLLNVYAYRVEGNPPWRTDLLQALFDAGWDDSGNGVDSIWHQLALAYLDQSHPAAGAKVVERITDPLIIIRMRSDKRFDAVAASLDKLPTPQEAAERRIAELRRLVAVSPKRVDLISALGTQLLVAGRSEEALALADTTLATIAADPTSFPNLDEKNWVMNDRASALRRLGRLDEALAEMESASRVDESGAPNVSQVLNLASLYCSAGRPKDALRAVERVKSGMSGYGRMVLSAVQHHAALQTGDRRAASEALNYLLAHRKESEAIVLEALLIEGRVDDAAQGLIRQFADPSKRDDALRFVQEFKTPPELVGDHSFSVHRDELLARDDVKAAVAQVGRMGVHEVFDYGGI
ncbi:tetratricopeptide repeat protein [Lysobacter terrae]